MGQLTVERASRDIRTAGRCQVPRRIISVPPASRQEPAAATGPSPATVATLVGELLGLGTSGWDSSPWPLVTGQDPSAWTVRVALSSRMTDQTVDSHPILMATAMSLLPWCACSCSSGAGRCGASRGPGSGAGPEPS